VKTVLHHITRHMEFDDFYSIRILEDCKNYLSQIYLTLLTKIKKFANFPHTETLYAIFGLNTTG